MRLPEDLRAVVERRLGRIREVHGVSGGCISTAVRLVLADRPIFLKYERSPPTGFFEVEAAGLRLLESAASGLRIPEVLDWSEPDAGGWGWIALEWVDKGNPRMDFGAALGTRLAALHRTPRREWGGDRDGFIGPLPQSNRSSSGWAEFWRAQRLQPQLERAARAGRIQQDDQWERLFDRLPELLAVAEEDGPSLLHGDLWSGNVLADEAGEPALIDPAAYHGHREVDLAMSELFGGFDRSFYAAYREAWPLRPGYERDRRAVYQLYYLLVHVNVFGTSYVRQTLEALKAALTSG